jgi:hypothetical protein
MKGALGIVSAWFEGVPFAYFIREPVARLGVYRRARRRAANEAKAA